MKKINNYGSLAFSLIFSFGVLGSVLSVPLRVIGATLPTPIVDPGTGGAYLTEDQKKILPVSLTNTGNTLNNYANWITGAFWVLAIGFLIYAAFKYLTAQGDATKMATAKQMVIYAIIAAGIAILAFGIRTIVNNLLSGA